MTEKQIILITGEATQGKSTCLRTLNNQKEILYLNTENKALPFKTEMQQKIIEDPYEVLEILKACTDAKNSGKFHTIVLDSLTYLMDMYENIHIKSASDSRAAWGNYAYFFKDFIKDIAKCPQNIICLAHCISVDINKYENVKKVPIKGSLKSVGIESHFTTVLQANRQPVNNLSDITSPLLNITDQEKGRGYKYVFQTRPTETNLGDPIRSPIDLFKEEEVFIDSDSQQLLNHLNTYYTS